MQDNIDRINTAINRLKTADDVALVAVSKRQPPEHIEQALAFGLRIFGENQVQEAKARWADYQTQYNDLELHLLGPLQSNKVSDAVALFDVIHSVDRLKIAEKIASECQKQQKKIQCFIQVNTGLEDQKSGIDVARLNDFYQQCIDLGLHVIGLMCLPPLDEEPAFHFALLRKKAKELGLQNLSMGMSSDYETALRLGATHIRVGSALFGARPSQ